MISSLFLIFKLIPLPLLCHRAQKCPIYDLKTHLIGEEKLNVTAVVDFQKIVLEDNNCQVQTKISDMQNNKDIFGTNKCSII